MPTTADRVPCRTPNSDKPPKSIDRWKFDAVRRAILASLPAAGDGVAWADLPGLVAARLPADRRAGLGSVPWYTVTVKLELERRGEVRRVAGPGPQRLVRAVKRP